MSANTYYVCNGSCSYSAILGGESNTASGESAFAIGSNGNAADAYSAVFSFDSTGTTCESQGNGTVNICTDGGVFINNVLLDSGSAGATGTSATVAGGDGNTASGE